MAELWIEFSAGRRGAGSIDCLRCGRSIHERTSGSGEWFDGEGVTENTTPGSDHFGTHTHEPAKEVGPKLGPFPERYVQLTYDTLRYEGETIAYYNRERGDWIIEDPRWAGEAYSDITIFVKGG